MPLSWAYGVTTVPERADDLLPRTLKSLGAAGFTRPRLFVDGADNALPYWGWDVDVTCRADRIGNFANWYLGMVELFCRQPEADRYLMLEDDVVCVRGLRDYLEAVPMPTGGYCNLFNHGERNSILTRAEPDGWCHSDQRGYGALALMFDRETVIRLLGSIAFVKHRLNLKKPRSGGLPRGEYNVDGAVVFALRNCGAPAIQEYVHKPSLVQHTGAESSLLGHDYRNATSKLFPWEEFDARSLIKGCREESVA